MHVVTGRHVTGLIQALLCERTRGHTSHGLALLHRLRIVSADLLVELRHTLLFRLNLAKGTVKTEKTELRQDDFGQQKRVTCLVCEQHRRLTQVQNLLLYTQVGAPGILLGATSGVSATRRTNRTWSTQAVLRTTAATSSSRFIDALSTCSFSIAARCRRMMVCESSAYALRFACAQARGSGQKGCASKTAALASAEGRPQQPDDAPQEYDICVAALPVASLCRWVPAVGAQRWDQ